MVQAARRNHRLRRSRDHIVAGGRLGGTGGRPATGARAVRSRAGYVFGHTYIAYGRLGDHGQPLETRYAGIYPLDDERGLIFGSVMPVAASVRGPMTTARRRRRISTGGASARPSTPGSRRRSAASAPPSICGT